MKRETFRLMVTAITLAAAIIATTPSADAQRRAEKKNNSEKVTSRQARKSTSATNSRTTRVIRPDQKFKKGDITRIPRKVERSSYTGPSVRQAPKAVTATRSRAPQKTENPQSRRVERNINSRNNSRGGRVVTDNRNRTGAPVANRERNRSDRNIPSPNYKGSDKYWSGALRGNNIRNNRNNRNNSYWNHNWENYRWNDRSWSEYYGSFTPYAFKSNRYYYYSPRYGHVIRRFVVKPRVFIYNRIPYYCYDGYFFVYHRGIGYVLTDLPYGVVFPELPYGYETVYINGYVYYRIGNLFFEFTGNGYQLVYYPERFYAGRF